LTMERAPLMGRTRAVQGVTQAQDIILYPATSARGSLCFAPPSTRAPCVRPVKRRATSASSSRIGQARARRHARPTPPSRPTDRSGWPRGNRQQKRLLRRHRHLLCRHRHPVRRPVRLLPRLSEYVLTYFFNISTSWRWCGEGRRTWRQRPPVPGPWPPWCRRT